MSQSDSINNWTVKFVISCCVVFKQIEVYTILVSVKSTGSWLHAGICPVFVRWVVLEILYNIVQTHLFILHMNQSAYTLWKETCNIFISRSYVLVGMRGPSWKTSCTPLAEIWNPEIHSDIRKSTLISRNPLWNLEIQFRLLLKYSASIRIL